MIKVTSLKYPELLVRLESESIQFESGEVSINDPKTENEFLAFVKRSDFLGLEVAEVAENSANRKPSKRSKNLPETDPENLV